MTLVASEYRIEERDITQLPEREMLSLARFQQALEQERLPDDPLTPLELIARRWRNKPAMIEATHWLVFADDEVVGRAELTRVLAMENPHWRDAWVGIHPAHRRRGLGRELLQRLIDKATDPEIVMGSWANDRVAAGGAFARAFGATEGLNNRVSELRLDALDRGLVREWAGLDPAGYELVWIDGDVPDELMENVIVAFDTMNSAPRGDLQFGNWRTTAEEIRDWERVRKSNGGVQRLLLALHAETGATAGFTAVNRHPLTPWVVGQQGTAVVPEHRGHGIGKWIKAAMLERILREWPEAKYVRTGNAYSNAPMLSINDRLGFTVIFSVVVWQAKLADVKARLEAHPA